MCVGIWKRDLLLFWLSLSWFLFGIRWPHIKIFRILFIPEFVIPIVYWVYRTYSLYYVHIVYVYWYISEYTERYFICRFYEIYYLFVKYCILSKHVHWQSALIQRDQSILWPGHIEGIEYTQSEILLIVWDL